ncbi:CHAT domain-containing protein [Scytonema sp. NUACC26]|uniref:CHAT domain-containing protein n=1 Tax=Scytonema sp. NUACC26 TaxID=3140176 RepID=UPI0034DC0D16
MQRILKVLLAVGIGLAPVVMQSTNQPVWGQTQNPQSEEALKLLNQALKQGREGQPQQAIETLKQVLAIAQQLKDRRLEANALLRIGLIFGIIEQPQKALEFYNQALLISRSVGDRTLEANTLNNIAEVYSKIGQPPKALAFFNQALVINRSVGDRALEATTLNNIAEVYSKIGQSQKALEFYNQALLINRSVGDRALEANTLNNIAEVYSKIGQRQKALEFYNQSLPITRAVGDPAEEAITLIAIGGVYKDIEQSQKALEFYNQALSIFRAVGNRAGEATTLNNIGGVYKDIGQPQKALEFYNQALPFIQSAGYRAFEAGFLNNIGGVYKDIGQPQKALEFYNQALLITRAVSDRDVEATTLSNIGLVYSNIGQPQKALEFHNQALPIRRAVGDSAGEAVTLSNIGAVYSEIGQSQKALEIFNQALLITRAMGKRADEATILSNIGSIYSKIGQLTKAATNYEQAVRITLEIRKGVAKNDRSEFLQQKLGTSISLVDLLIRQNKADSAYEWANLATTADLIDYARLLNAKVANPDAQRAIDEWNQLYQQLQFLRQRLQEKFSDTLSQQMREREAKVNQQAEAISRRFPEVAELFETTPTDIAQLRASIPAGTTVIHPVLLTNIKNVPNTIALFILTKDKLTVKLVPVNPAELDNLLTQTHAQLTNRFNDKYLDNLEKLYDLLIRPVEGEIQATNPKQLSIIATGTFRYIPFEALYNSKTDKYLIQEYPVSYLTRLSTHSLQATRTKNLTSAKKVLALGNPIPKDPLVLPGSEIEVKSITQIMPGSEAIIGNKATLATFKTQAPRFPLLHLATHGCFQRGGCPKLGLEENILLFADKKLNIADAALLGLSNTDSIALSACQTALNTDSKGKLLIGDGAEPITGLAYLFERAGAKAVIANLWSIEDKTTQEIMVQFYQNLKQGMSKGEALRQAKLSQINSHPFFWSSFVLIGDAQ